MNFAQLQQRIARAEALLEGRQHQVTQQWSTIRRTWRAAWTPGRIVVAGLGLGFVTGVSEPRTALGSLAGKVGALPKLLQMLSAVSALFTATQAQAASAQAERAAQAVADEPAPPAAPTPWPVAA
ncbi:MAG: hypothetical protein QM581_12960, partial [Pseudomonas sp.]